MVLDGTFVDDFSGKGVLENNFRFPLLATGGLKTGQVINATQLGAGSKGDVVRGVVSTDDEDLWAWRNTAIVNANGLSTEMDIKPNKSKPDIPGEYRPEFYGDKLPAQNLEGIGSFGDSGGSLIASLIKGKPTIIGVHSNGNATRRRERDEYQVGRINNLTRVDTHRNWINNAIHALAKRTEQLACDRDEFFGCGPTFYLDNNPYYVDTNQPIGALCTFQADLRVRCPDRRTYDNVDSNFLTPVYYPSGDHPDGRREFIGYTNQQSKYISKLDQFELGFISTEFDPDVPDVFSQEFLKDAYGWVCPENRCYLNGEDLPEHERLTQEAQNTPEPMSVGGLILFAIAMLRTKLAMKK